jgi:tetratricopeptide (TPR) repeat protein
MKKISLAILLFCAFEGKSQIKVPALSPFGKVEQTVGLTNIKIEYSRPSKRERNVFPDVVPFGEIWRAGANKNTIISIDDNILFGKDTLKSGTYSIFVKPETSDWTVYFYKDTENWGTPEKWNEKLIAVKIVSPIKKVNVVETFTISIENIGLDGANLSFYWDETSVIIPFKTDNLKKINESISKTLKGPAASDYYRAADYYYQSNNDLKQATDWINTAIQISGASVPAYYLYKKALILEKANDNGKAIETVKLAILRAKQENNDEYVRMGEKLLNNLNKK